MPKRDADPVRALLSEEEYERLATAADREGTSVEAALRDAVREYADVRPFDPDDPLFDVEPAAGAGEPLSAEKVDEYLYGERADEPVDGDD